MEDGNPHSFFIIKLNNSKSIFRFALHLIVGFFAFVIGIRFLNERTTYPLLENTPFPDGFIIMAVVSFILAGFNFFLVYKILK